MSKKWAWIIGYAIWLDEQYVTFVNNRDEVEQSGTKVYDTEQEAIASVAPHHVNTFIQWRDKIAARDAAEDAENS